MDTQQENAIIAQAVARAEAWLNRANALLTAEEKAIQDQMHRLLTHPLDKVVLTRLIDESFRSHDPHRVADQVNAILKSYGVPDFFNRVEKLLVQMFMGLGRHFPALAVPRMIDHMRHSSSRAIIAGEPEALRAHLLKRTQQGVRMNINHLGEALLGETEAKRRLQTYIDDLQNPDIEYISVKISTIYSQINSLAFEHTVEVLKQRLATLYRTAMTHFFTRADGRQVPKFVNLDMEEYRDLEITFAAFVRTLEAPEFADCSAGIVLQAYLPDSFSMQQKLTEWAQKRCATGGAAVKLRIVKGANMEMELLEAALHNWPSAPYNSKLDVDANYKRMVAFGMVPERIRAVHLGIASHNLFELAYALELAEAYRVTDYCYFEMLEGMADHVRRALCEKAHDVLLYAPVAAKEQFINAIAYLVRRLDENTAPENFLRYAPGLKAGSAEWDLLKSQFIAACHRRDSVSAAPRRTQNRATEKFDPPIGSFFTHAFVNEADTDFALAANRRWAETIRDQWQNEEGATLMPIPVVVGGQAVFEDRRLREVIDPNQLPARVCVARFALATEQDAATAVATAKADPDGWRATTLTERHRVLAGVAMQIRRCRADLIGAAAAETGKIFTETDVEVSEAIDFAEFYPLSLREMQNLGSVRVRGRGVGLVVSPWNFPVAIACGGIVAALSAGNTVIFKPSSDAVLTAWTLCNCFWRAGISRNTLQFTPCTGDGVGATLAAHPDVDFVILTGGTQTGLKLLRQRPELYLAAETGGKNATIVTDMADRDQAIKNVIYSAFGNSGQKCSATSLLILEKSIYDDPHFKDQLVDAAQSMATGSAWDFANRMGPLIRPPAGDLLRALTALEPGETWALQPRMIHDNPHLWTPGIKYGVGPGSVTHMTEFFGPLLAVMRAANLEEAVNLVNQTGYGLTSGLESLDRREQAWWKDHVKAGNLYINRGTTGAITLRQPFGGMGRSALGSGLKAGGPDYAAQFADFEQTGYPAAGPIAADSALLRLAAAWERDLAWDWRADHKEDLYKTVRAIRSFLFAMENRFGRQLDFFHLRGQDNILRHLAAGKLVIRLHKDDSLFDVLARIAAGRISGCQVMVSIPTGLSNAAVAFLHGRDGCAILGPARTLFEDDDGLGQRIATIDRIRYAGPDRVPASVFEAAAASGFYIARAPVLMEGRIELLHYLRQQSICDNYHRYGNLGERAILGG